MENDSGISSIFYNKGVLIIGANEAVTWNLAAKISAISEVWYLYVVLHNGDEESRTVLTNACKGKCKPVVLIGDLTQPCIGIRGDDVKILQQNVSIVYHVGVTEYAAPLSYATKVNLWGTSHVLDFCQTFERLEAFVLVSTAFTMNDGCSLEEAAEEYPITTDVLMELSKWMNDEQLDSVVKTSSYGTNGYVLTKSLSESLVQKRAKFPVTIVRPSLVAENCAEIFDIINGVLYFKSNELQLENESPLVTDVVPAIGVVNMILSASWYLIEHGPKHLTIYHCCGAFHPALSAKKIGKRHFLQGLLKKCGILKTIVNNGLYKPYVKSSFEYEKENVKQLLSSMSEDDRKAFNISLADLKCVFPPAEKIKRGVISNEGLFSKLKSFRILCQSLIFIVATKRWLTNSTPAGQILYITVCLVLLLREGYKRFIRSNSSFRASFILTSS